MEDTVWRVEAAQPISASAHRLTWAAVVSAGLFSVTPVLGGKRVGHEPRPCFSGGDRLVAPVQSSFLSP